MIRTFPETGFIVRVVDGAILVDAPMPLAVLLVHKACLGVVPAACGYFEVFRRAEMLPEIYVSDDGLTL